MWITIWLGTGSG
jgi:hypothetical protein